MFFLVGVNILSLNCLDGEIRVFLIESCDDKFKFVKFVVFMLGINFYKMVYISKMLIKWILCKVI